MAPIGYNNDIACGVRSEPHAIRRDLALSLCRGVIEESELIFGIEY